MAEIDLNSFWTLLPTQEKFLQSISACQPNEMRAVAYVGAVGSGKSWALCRAAIGLALTYPRMRILLGRQLSTDLRDSTEQTFFELITDLEEKIKAHYPPEVRAEIPPIGEEHKAAREYEFSNGSVILFRPLDEAEKKYKSLNVAAVGIDEADQVHEAAVQMLMARRRQMGYPLLLFVVSNPTSYAHWLYKWFVKSRQDNYHLFRTNSFENQKNLPPGYIEELLRKFSPDWVQRYVQGEWGGLTEGVPIYAGLFDPAVHVKEARYFGGNPVWVGIDFGYQSPGVVWAHPDRHGRCQIVREWAPKEIDTYKLAQGILKRNGVWFPNATFMYFCGHDGSQHAHTAEKTGLEILAEHGMVAYWRAHHLEAAFTVVRNMLKIRDDDLPNLTVDPSCELMVEGFMGAYRYKPPAQKTGIVSTDPKPLKDDIHDPVFDAWRYIAVNTYSTAGESLISEPRIKLFGVKETDDGDRPPTVRRRFDGRGWTQRDEPLRRTGSWT